MPSLQDALRNAVLKVQPPVPSATLDDWDKDDQQIIQEKTVQQTTANKHRFDVSNNVTRTTFNFVRDNPGCTFLQATDALEVQGFKKNSTGSILNQLVSTNQVVRAENGGLSTTGKEYVPLSAKLLKQAREARKQEKKNQGRMGNLEKAWAARKAKAAERKANAEQEPKQKYQPKEEAKGITALATTPIQAAPSVPLVELTADKILDTLGVRQAKLLYAELKKIFEE